MVTWGNVYEAIVEGNSKEVQDIVMDALSDGESVDDILNKAMIPAIVELERRLECGDIIILEVLMGARTMNAGMDILKPYLSANLVRKPLGNVAIITVKSDLDDVSKNVLKTLTAGKGFRVIDFPANISPENFVHAVNHEKITIVAGFSILKSATDEMMNTAEAIKNAGLNDNIKLILGGEYISSAICNAMGVQCVARDINTTIEFFISGD